METITISNQFGVEYAPLDLPKEQAALAVVINKIKADLQQHKYILFKNQANTAEDFLSFSEAIGNDFVSYKGGAYVREKVKKGNNTLLSVTGGSGMKIAIPMHGEMHYKKIKPPLLWFCCINAPLSNGETTLCDSELLFESLSMEAKTLFLHHNIQYIRTYTEERWQGVFQTTAIQEAIPFFKANDLEYSLDKNNVLTTKYTCSALYHSADGKKHFINNILPINYQEKNGMEGNLVRLENGDPIPANILEELVHKSEAQKINVQWEKGDVVLIDNFKAMHGRNQITCNNRNIIVRMSGR